MNAKRKRVLAIFSHCDDEVVCGWPVLQNDGYDRHLLIIATQEKGYEALKAVCQNEGITLIEHTGFRNRFGKDSNIRAEVEQLLQKTVQEVKPDVIFTHNGSGEYGHVDHLFLNRLVMDGYSEVIKILTSDLEIRSELWPKQVVKEEGESVSVQIDTGFWDRCKAEYEKRNCWTTNRYIKRNILPGQIRLFTRETKRIDMVKKKIVWLCDIDGWAFANQVVNISNKLPEYEHVQVVLKVDKVNKKYLYTKEDHHEIEKAEIVIAMTPSALRFTDRRNNVITRLSGVRSI